MTSTPTPSTSGTSAAPSKPRKSAAKSASKPRKSASKSAKRSTSTPERKSPRERKREHDPVICHAVAPCPACAEARHNV